MNASPRAGATPRALGSEQPDSEAMQVPSRQPCSSQGRACSACNGDTHETPFTGAGGAGGAGGGTAAAGSAAAAPSQMRAAAGVHEIAASAEADCTRGAVGALEDSGGQAAVGAARTAAHGGAGGDAHESTSSAEGRAGGGEANGGSGGAVGGAKEGADAVTEGRNCPSCGAAVGRADWDAHLAPCKEAAAAAKAAARSAEEFDRSRRVGAGVLGTSSSGAPARRVVGSLTEGHVGPNATLELVMPAAKDHAAVLQQCGELLHELDVVAVWKVHNPFLEARFELVRQQTEFHNKFYEGSAGANVQALFHGTDADTMAKILARGFNRSYGGRNGLAFGRGVYFARGATYSVNPRYARPNGQGVQHVMLCDVVVGDSGKGRAGLLEPPLRNDDDPAEGFYDTAVDRVDAPSVVVAFEDSQAVARYVIAVTAKARPAAFGSELQRTPRIRRIPGRYSPGTPVGPSGPVSLSSAITSGEHDAGGTGGAGAAGVKQFTPHGKAPHAAPAHPSPAVRGERGTRTDRCRIARAAQALRDAVEIRQAAFRAASRPSRE